MACYFNLFHDLLVVLPVHKARPGPGRSRSIRNTWMQGHLQTELSHTYAVWNIILGLSITWFVVGLSLFHVLSTIKCNSDALSLCQRMSQTLHWFVFFFDSKKSRSWIVDLSQFSNGFVLWCWAMWLLCERN